MKTIGGIGICAVVALLAAGCTQLGPSPEARKQARYNEYAPKFTDEQKENMTLDEKLAIYNAHVVPEDQLVCRVERRTGSHHRGPRCFTRGEMEEMRLAAEEFMRQARNAGT